VKKFIVVTSLFLSFIFSEDIFSAERSYGFGGGCHLALKNIGNEFDGKRIFWTPFLNLTFKM
jgi:hypothetical protein